MVNEIGDNNKHCMKKYRALAEKFIVPNAAIRVGRSIITQNTAGSLDLVINNTFISLIPDIRGSVFYRSKDSAGKARIGRLHIVPF